MQRDVVDLYAYNLPSHDLEKILLASPPPHINSTEFHDAPRKRRKLSVSHVTGDGGEAFTTIASLRVQIHFEAPAFESQSPVRCGTLPQFAFTHVEESQGSLAGVTGTEYSLKIARADGSCSSLFNIRAAPSPCELNLLKDAIALRKPRHGIGIQSTFTLEQHSTVPSNAVNIAVRILLPNATSLLANVALPRKSRLRKYLPRTAQSPQGPWRPQDFYDHVHTPAKDETPDLGSIEQLQCDLYPFQQRAVRWMLEREGALPLHNTSEALPHDFVEFVDGDGRPRFISSLLGIATADRSVISQSQEHNIGAGLLAEEMGLGKTVEIIALICLARRPESFAEGTSKATSATLIITPPAILQQWRDELKALAPSLRVATYDGMRTESCKDDAQINEKFGYNDIILTTYPTIARDIYHAEGPVKTLRHEKRYEKRLSPLTQLHFWRVILDEAQMVESGVSNAAKVASLIPSRNRWCVSGTPARTSRDLLGLITFLRVQPYCSLPSIWDRLVDEHRAVLHALFESMTLRHTKRQIKDEIVLPAQKRVVITIPFTTVEEQHYASLFQQMADDCGLDSDGSPLDGQWNPDDVQVIDKMRTWLVRLRQTCLHPEVGSRNRKALGSAKGPLRTVAEVLAVMIEQNEAAARSEERTLLLSQIRRGQIHEHAECTQEALDIWLVTLARARKDVSECRDQLRSELEKPTAQTVTPTATETDEDLLTRTGPYRQRLRSALELEHMCTFFVANAFFQLKTKATSAETEQDNIGVATLTLRAAGIGEVQSQAGESVKEADLVDRQLTSMGSEDAGSNERASSMKDHTRELLSAKAKEFEEREERYYEEARLLRQELLTEAREKADRQLIKVKSLQSNLCSISGTPPMNINGGIQSRQLFDKIAELCDALQRQQQTLTAWRTKSVELLTVPLVDQEKTDLKGDEYEESTKQQDEVYVYVDAFRAIVSDRHGMISGVINQLVDHEMDMLLRDAREGKGHSPQLLIKLLRERNALKPPRAEGTSLRGLSTELRELKTNLRGLIERGNNRAAAESLIVDEALNQLHQVTSEQTKIAGALTKEVDSLKSAMNVRLEYYRQLQSISDTVAPYEEEMTEDQRRIRLAAHLQNEIKLQDKIASLRSKGRYLVHIQEETDNMSTQKTCIICTSPFENGVLTSCGHTYCTECLRLWWNQHRNCPTCKKHLRRNDFHQITYKPKELTMEEESSSTGKSATPSETGSAIYTSVQETLLNQIKDIDLDGSFGTKIDTLARHLLWIREHDPGTKSIIFSQYRDFLDVLARAFSHFKIAYSSIDRKDGIQKFRNDPHIECFFLHAKAQSSGLNLVNATHVFLCEPLINTAIELQAIARVHRIGQHNETTVWMYLVEGTVEKSIYDISVQRRLTHMGQVDEDSGTQLEQKNLESRLEAANSEELEQTPLSHLLTKGSSGGELVRKEDLWNCLFASRPDRAAQAGQKAPIAVAQHLGADAAEMRARG